MMNSGDYFALNGTFAVSLDRQVFGELRVAGTESSLRLRDDTLFNTRSLTGDCIMGTLHDLTKVTLIQCVTTEWGSSSHNGERYHYSHIFPHFVVRGSRHFSPSERTVRDITLFVDDASVLFYDFEAFGSVIDARPYIAHLLKADPEIAIGEYPQIAYFTGKTEIVRVSTVLGDVTAHHNPTSEIGGPKGVRIDNTISITITPDTPIPFFEATDRVLTLLRLLEILIGRSQKLEQLWLRIGDGSGTTERLRVYWSHAPGRGQTLEDDGYRPHPADTLIDPIRDGEQFSSVLARWLHIDAQRKDARLRFLSSFGQGSTYSIDRLIGAANMFDILPASAVPRDVELSSELLNAKQAGEVAFGKLPPSPERDSVLSSLGRLGKSALKHKVRFRAQRILDAVGERFPEFTLVLDEAINCRNHYVHGKNAVSKIDYSNNFDLVIFFTNSLEFVFATSELVESGWNMQAWCEAGTTMSHPFGRYCVEYAANLAAFLEQKRKTH